MANTHSDRNTSPKSRKAALGDTVAADALLHTGNGAAPEDEATEDMSDLEGAVSEPNGTKTINAESASDEDDEALAEIEEAIKDGEDEDAIEVEEANLSYAIRKPLRAKKRFEFFLAHPDPSLWVKAWVVIDNLGMEETYHLPLGDVRAALIDHLVHVEFVPCISSRGKVFVCPIPCADVTGRQNSWTKSLRDDCLIARTRLTKILSDQDDKRYRPFHPKNKNVPLPVWPEDFSRKTMLARMFRGAILRDLNSDIAREILNAGVKIEK